MVLNNLWKKSGKSNTSALSKLPDNLVISHAKDVAPAQIQDLCTAVGWNRREPVLIVKALNNSLAVVSIWRDEELVGFGRATGDMVFNATIWDMAVRPEYQHQGIGTLIMKELLNDIDELQIPLITLYADPGTDNFYRKFGFCVDPAGVRGMFRDRSGLAL